MFNSLRVKKHNKTKGFTLIEIMVASSVFAVVMLLVSGSILSIISANRKSKNLRSVMDNLNLTLESMSRTVRFGTTYHCGNDSLVPYNQPQDCPGGDVILTIQSVDGVQTSYFIDNTNRIVLRRAGVSYYLTSPDVTFNGNSLKFFVIGSSPSDQNQPKVIITLSGSVGSNHNNEQSAFSLQTTITQRKFDLNP